MKKFFLLIIACIALFSCSKDEALLSLPVARFETEKTYYDDGEVIQFINTSEKANSYSWSFGNSTFSNEPNPEFTIDLKSFQGCKLTAVLTAYSTDGLKNTYSQNLTISKRLLLDLHILWMEHSLEEKITITGDQQPNLIIYMGPINDPLEWIIPEQTIPPSKFNLESGYPRKIYVMRTWPTIAMNNELWFIHLSIQTQGDNAEKRIMIKEFRFNPCKTDFIIKEDGIRQFVIEDEEMAIAIDFEYC